MPKPACLKCRCFYRPKRNGYRIVEGMPNGTVMPGEENIRGLAKPEAWQPYKLWVADLWQCPDCGHELVTGWGVNPLSEHYKPGFSELIGGLVQINDC